MKTTRNEPIEFKIISKARCCPECGKPTLKPKIFEHGDVYIEVPHFDCHCLEDIKAARVLKEENKKIEKLLSVSNIDAEFMENDFKVYRENLKPYYNNLDWIRKGKQLLIYGDAGNHKTGQVTAIMKRAIEHGMRCLYYRATEIPYQKDYDSIERCDLLVLDNFGKDTFENSRGALFDILDKRIHRYKSNVLIVNNNVRMIEKIYTMPMASRVKGFVKLEVDGADKRGAEYGRK